MLTEPLYVGYRTYLPDEGTVNKVKEKLKENNIDINELVAWPVDHCQQEKPSTEKNVPDRDSDEGKGT